MSRYFMQVEWKPEGDKGLYELSEGSYIILAAKYGVKQKTHDFAQGSIIVAHGPKGQLIMLRSRDMRSVILWEDEVSPEKIEITLSEKDKNPLNRISHYDNPCN